MAASSRKAPNLLRHAWKVAELVLAVGVLACGCGIISTTQELKSQLDGPYQANLDALRESLTEVDRNLVLLQKEAQDFDKYLTTLRRHTLGIRKHVNSTEKQTTQLTKIAGTSVPGTLNRGEKSLDEAAKMIRKSANRMGKVPGDMLAEERKSLYSIAGHLDAVSNTMASLSADLHDQISMLGLTASGSLKSTSEVLKETESLLGEVQNGSLSQLPTTLKVLSTQLKTHTELLEGSRDLLQRVSLAVILIGASLICLGLILIGRIFYAHLQSGARSSL